VKVQKPSRERVLGPAGITAVVCQAVFLGLVVLGAALMSDSPQTMEELESIQRRLWWRGLGMLLTAGTGTVAFLVAVLSRRMTRVLGWLLGFLYIGWWSAMLLGFMLRGRTA
jgi:hypothetical protein